MLEKIIVPHDFGVPEVNVIRPTELFGIKCAKENGVSACGRSASFCGATCATKQANEDLKSFIRNLKPDPKYLYLHIIAMGSGEYFGPNTNGDYFPEEGLARKYDTFRTIAKLFKHHINKDPNISYGHVPYSTYNNPMHRIELIVAVDREKAPDIVQKAENGERLAYSMSCKVPWDQCSICGNKSIRKPDYCTHITNHLLEIQPDGRQVYMINSDPTFFDISYVLKPADKTAMLLNKVASENEKSGALFTRTELMGKAKHPKIQAEIQKHSAIKKEFEAILEPALSKDQREGIHTYVMPLLKSAEPDLPIEALGKFPIEDILSTLAMCGIVCKPSEYSRIIIIAKKDDNYKPEISSENFNDEVYRVIKDLLLERSFYNPYMGKRLIRLGLKQDRSKEASGYFVKAMPHEQDDHSARNKLLLLGALGGGAYAAYKTEVGRTALENIIKMIEEKPGKFLLIAGLGALALKSAPILGRQTVSDSFAKYQNNIPYGADGIIVNTKQSSCIPIHIQRIVKQAMDPFGMLYLETLKN